MFRGAKEFKELLEKHKDKRPVLLYGDPDPDGLFALLLMCRFCDMLGIKYSYYCNGVRQHGFKLDPATLRGFMVIAADFAITQEEMEELVKHDVVVLSTDHHLIQSEFIDVSCGEARGIVINNQYEFEDPEKEFLSGAGVFYELILDLYPEFKDDVFEAVVGITLLSDVRPIENKQARKYLKKTFTADTDNPYIAHLIKGATGGDFGFGKPKLDRNFIDYSLNPKINSLLRFDKTRDAMNFILNNHPLDQGVRDKQKSLIGAMHQYATVLDLPNLTILSITDTDYLDFDTDVTGFIGLFCSDYMDKVSGKSAFGFVMSKGRVIRASFRGKFDDVHYRRGFVNLGIDANGHPSAFGVKDFTPKVDTWQQLNDLVQELEEGHEYKATIVPVGNIATFFLKKGMDVAVNNCFVRDRYRTYLKYTGDNIVERKRTYKTEELTHMDELQGKQADLVKGGVPHYYLRDTNGNPIVKYIEFEVDGRTVKSFGVELPEGLILPVLEKGYVSLYVRKNFEEE